VIVGNDDITRCIASWRWRNHKNVSNIVCKAPLTVVGSLRTSELLPDCTEPYHKMLHSSEPRPCETQIPQ
jgi:hypothetical protein